MAGHGRLAAAKQLGYEFVPIVRIEHLTAAQRRAYVIADNKLALNAGWDEELLALELAELADLELDFEADVHRTYVSDIESGRRNPTATMLEKLAKPLGISAGRLLD